MMLRLSVCEKDPDTDPDGKRYLESVRECIEDHQRCSLAGVVDNERATLFIFDCESY